uniref:Coiled-coil domain-containing protein 43 n=1 Tax=Phallusia mammillata TaxID=59560 RepID=A0A6F9D7W1_9ASCI|nr:coiled-coil domain-containing protein 43 [Phallusia mammillata]
MAEIESEDFEGWLCAKLTSLDIDSDVYASYITGILEENDDDTNTQEALAEVLGSMLEDGESVSAEVLRRWSKTTDTNEDTNVKDSENGIDAILAAHVEASQQQLRTKGTRLDEQSSAVKQSVIAMYSSVEDGPQGHVHSESRPEPRVKSVDDALGVFKNTNAASVTQAEKVERQKQKEMADKKKEKDKHDRELQKIKKNERKEKEKKRTQKKEKTR